jgi:hypothetical protein
MGFVQGACLMSENTNYKAGDTVVVDGDRNYEQYFRLATIECVTPTGQIRLSDKSRFLPNGYQIGGDDRLLPPTEANLSLHAAQELRTVVRKRANRLLNMLEDMSVANLKRTSEALLLAMSTEPVANIQELHV